MTYKIGNKFTRGMWGEFILAQVDSNPSKAALISLSRGTMWHGPVEIQESYQVTQEEFEAIANYSHRGFKPVN